jgi:hypothetical protein
MQVSSKEQALLNTFEIFAVPWVLISMVIPKARPSWPCARFRYKVMAKITPSLDDGIQVMLAFDFRAVMFDQRAVLLFERFRSSAKCHLRRRWWVSRRPISSI